MTLAKNGFFSLLFFMLSWTAWSQCDITEPSAIIDRDTTILRLTVLEASIDDLSDPSQGVCGVYIDFRHSFVGDLQFDLVSPAGQRVTLIGNIGVGGATNFTNWRVFFTSCGSASSPDAGFSPVWQNGQVWGLFGNYSGTYYPHQGCLEDFNVGTASGIWTLEIVDGRAFDAGLIRGFSLFFCNSEDIICRECNPTVGAFAIEKDSLCRFDERINLPIQAQFSEDPSPGFYYSHVVFQDGIAVQDTTSVDPSTLGIGEFKVCSISIDSADYESVDLLGLTELAVRDLLRQGQICAAISDSCLILSIFDQPDLDTISFYLCVGQTIDFEGMTYDAVGDFDVSIDGVICDTLRTLRILSIPDSIVFSASAPSFSCGVDSISITADSSLIGYDFQWSTNDGQILSDVDSITIYVSSPGIYFLEVDFGSCSIRDSIEIVVDPSGELFFELVTSQITCANPSVQVVVAGLATTSESFLWSGSSAFQDNGGFIVVDQPGLYQVTVTDSNGCSGSNEIEVTTDLEFPMIEVQLDNLSCTNQQAGILVTDVDGKITNALWIGADIISSDFLSMTTRSAGFYTYVYEGENGCVDSLQLEIVDTSYDIDIQLSDDSLNCIFTNLTLSPVISVPESTLQDILWTGPGVSSSSLELQVTEAGIYTLSLVDSFGCIGARSISITQDTVPPLIGSFEGVLTCETDTVLLSPEIQGVVSDVFWTGPGGFSSSILAPSISTPGQYDIRVLSPNGCESFGSFEVRIDTIAPTADFGIFPITCTSPIGKIIPNSNVNFEFQWSGLGLLSNPTLDSAFVNIEGVVELILTNLNNGCNNTFEFFVADESERLPFSINLDTITCLHPEATIFLEAGFSVNSISWFDGATMIQVDTFRVARSGIFRVNFFDDRGCAYTEDFEVVVDTLSPSGDIMFDGILDCNTSVITAFVSGGIGTVSYEWRQGNMVIGLDTSVSISSMEDIFLNLVGSNGCETLVSAPIPIDFSRPLLRISEQWVIGCDQEDVWVFPTEISASTEFEWIIDGQIVRADSIRVTGSESNVAIRVIGPNGCDTLQSLSILLANALPEVELVGDTITCKEPMPSIGFTAVSSVSSWNWFDSLGTSLGGLQSIDVSEPGWYFLDLRSSDGCRKVDSIFVEELRNTPSGQIQESGILGCGNDKVVLSFLPEDSGFDLSFLWRTTDGSILGDSTNRIVEISREGTYALIVEDLETGCSTSLSYSVQGIDLENFNVNFSKREVTCSTNGSIQVLNWNNAQLPVTFQLSDLNGMILSGLTDLASDTYILSWEDARGCKGDTLIIIDLIASIDYVLDGPNLVMPNQEVDFVASQFSRTYESIYWIVEGDTICNGCSEVSIAFDRDSEIEVIVVDDNGCIVSKKMKVSLIKEEAELLPNIFAPGTAGPNGRYDLSRVANLEFIRSYLIFDRWGNLMYSAENFDPQDSDFFWDGSFGGVFVQPGVYVFFGILVFENGEERHIYRPITLLR